MAALQADLSRLSDLAKHKGYLLLTGYCEEAIAQILNQVLDSSNPSLEKLIARETLLGELKGIKRVFNIVDAKINELKYSISSDIDDEEDEDG